MSDEAWLARKGNLFPDGGFDQGLYEGSDEFIGRLRELEDGEDPFKDERRSLLEETVMAMSTVPGGFPFRDERDRELWSQRNVLWLMPSKRRFLVTPFEKAFLTAQEEQEDQT